MILKTYLKTKHLFSADMVDNITALYGTSEEPPTWLEDDMLAVYERYIKSNMSRREIFSDTDKIEEIEEEVQERTELLFMSNYLKYQHLHDLFTAEYNPIWNVDGTETTTRNLTDNKTSTGSGSDTVTHNTTNTTTHNVTDTATYNTTEGGTSTDGRTTFDASTFYDTDKTIESKTHTGTDTNAKTGTEATAITGTEGTQRTSNGTDAQTVNETIQHTRGGNIGVTSTQDLATQEMRYAEQINFIKIVCRDIVREICLAC